MWSTHWKKSSLINSYKPIFAYQHTKDLYEIGVQCPLCNEAKPEMWFAWIYKSKTGKLSFFERATNSICPKDFAKILYSKKVKNLVLRPTITEKAINLLVRYARI